MPKDKANRDEYPKLNEDDKRWKIQDEFDSVGVSRLPKEEESASNDSKVAPAGKPDSGEDERKNANT